MKTFLSAAYDALINRTHRRRSPTVIKTEDALLKGRDRSHLTASVQDVIRNFEVAAWAVRCHVNYVAQFRFRSTSGNTEWNNVLERWVEDVSTAQQFDAAGRHSLRNALRLIEALRTINGDVGILKLTSGQVQIIEGDRISGKPPESVDEWVNGVLLGDAGRARQYCINSRVGGRLVFERTVPAHKLYLHGYYSRYDQIRGVSPLAPSLNRLKDLYENIDYALAKAKVAQLFGLAIFQNQPDDYDDAPVIDPTKGPFTVNLDKDAKAEFLHVDTPGNSFQEFNNLCIELSLKCLDIPYSMFSEGKITWHGSKTALAQYKKSCQSKIADNQELLGNWTKWRLGVAIANGEINPEDYGVSVQDALRDFKWVAAGIPYWDKSREVAGDLLSVQAGFQTMGDIIEERFGDDFFDVVDRRAREIEYLRSKGIAVEGILDIKAEIDRAREEAE